jgi:hypothetical protein
LSCSFTETLIKNVTVIEAAKSVVKTETNSRFWKGLPVPEQEGETGNFIGTVARITSPGSHTSLHFTFVKESDI